MTRITGPSHDPALGRPGVSPAELGPMAPVSPEITAPIPTTEAIGTTALRGHGERGAVSFEFIQGAYDSARLAINGLRQRRAERAVRRHEGRAQDQELSGAVYQDSAGTMISRDAYEIRPDGTRRYTGSWRGPTPGMAPVTGAERAHSRRASRRAEKALRRDTRNYWINQTWATSVNNQRNVVENPGGNRMKVTRVERRDPADILADHDVGTPAFEHRARTTRMPAKERRMAVGADNRFLHFFKRGTQSRYRRNEDRAARYRDHVQDAADGNDIPGRLLSRRAARNERKGDEAAQRLLRLDTEGNDLRDERDRRRAQRRADRAAARAARRRP